MPFDAAEANRLVNACTNKATYSAPTVPMMLRLMTAMGANASTNGTEVANAGGSAYAPQNATTATPSGTNGLITSTGAVTYPNMPATTTVGAELWDSAGTPRRILYGSLTASKTTALGDSLVIAAGSLQIQVT